MNAELALLLYQDLEIKPFMNHSVIQAMARTKLKLWTSSLDLTRTPKHCILNYDVGEEVAFDGSGSSDPKGNQLVFKWFFGDGHESSEMNPIHVYEESGTYTVTLFVQDNLNQVQQLSKTVYVGHPPVATILSPADGDEFYVGQVLTVEGEAFHLNGTSFEDFELIWEVRKHHDDHYHPFLDPVNGNNIKLPPGPHPEDFHAATNSYLEVILYAKDTESGLTGKTSRLVQPILVSVGIDSFPPVLIVRVDDEPVTAYQTIVSWQEHELELVAEDQPPYMFVAWSDGWINPIHSIPLNASELSITAVFCSENEGTCADNLEWCTGICSEKICIAENVVATSPPDQNGSFDENRYPNAVAMTFFVVIGIGVIAIGAIFLRRRILLNSQQTLKVQTESTSAEGPHEQPLKSKDEESPGGFFHNSDDVSDILSNDDSKPAYGTVVTHDTTPSTNDQLL
ncbi:PKD domain containing protein [Nitzschia inconspicua]|uniref:PKD domain containing protein n=1 Tax=Nitzschia inconspicua TaxID=303405 RepID=A0A9K3KY45_9STRA|nr:PKD domain containing protein [Nitzschia inconspicua]